jgi:hypothetical protein
VTPTPSELLPPDIQADVRLLTVFLFALMNPVAIAVAVWMGRRANQPAKLAIAAFAGAAAGSAVLWFAALLRVPYVATPARAAAGIFVAQWIFCLGYAWIGYRTRPVPPNS